MTQAVSVFIGLGSNLDNPLQQVQQAVVALTQLPKTQVIAVSSAYQSRAVGPGEQDNYINAVAMLATHLAPLDLLDHLQAIEAAQLRQRILHWGPRTLDLDMLLYGEQTIAEERLKVPHPFLTQRNFVLIPLAEIAPQLVLPDGQSLRALCRQVGDDGLTNTGIRLFSTGDTL